QATVAGRSQGQIKGLHQGTRGSHRRQAEPGSAFQNQKRQSGFIIPELDRGNSKTLSPRLARGTDRVTPREPPGLRLHILCPRRSRKQISVSRNDLTGCSKKTEE